jgi:hypothetical protein
MLRIGGAVGTVVQDVRHQRADGLVAGPRREGGDEVGQIGLAPGVSHGATLQGGSNHRKGLVASRPTVLPRPMSNSQPDLFGDQQSEHIEVVTAAFEPPSPEFVARIRNELEGTLRTVRTAPTLPWPDLTRATLAELRFHSIARWLPDQEGVALRTAFEAEIARLYEEQKHCGE